MITLPWYWSFRSTSYWGAFLFLDFFQGTLDRGSRLQRPSSANGYLLWLFMFSITQFKPYCRGMIGLPYESVWGNNHDHIIRSIRRFWCWLLGTFITTIPFDIFFRILASTTSFFNCRYRTNFGTSRLSEKPSRASQHHNLRFQSFQVLIRTQYISTLPLPPPS